MKKIYISLILILMYSIEINAQSSLSGSIYCEESLEPLLFANVVLFNLDNKMITGAETDFDGEFIIQNLKPGKYQIEGSYIGYQKNRMEITIRAGQDAYDIALKPRIVLPECTITCCFGVERCGCILRGSVYTEEKPNSSAIKKQREFKPEAAPEIHIYPNPGAEDVNIFVPKDKSIACIYDVFGKLIHRSTKLNAGNYSVDVRLFPVGQYVVALEHEDELLTESLVVVED